MNANRATEALCRSLLPGELLLWTGRPSPGYRWRGADWIAVCTGLALIAFAVHHYLGEDGGTFAIAFVVASWGVILLAAPLIHRLERNSILTYAVTTQRAITVTRRLAGTKVRTILLRFPCRVELELHRNGTGSVYFGDRGTRLGTGAKLGVPMHFRHVPDAKVVYQLIIQHMPSPLCAGCGYNLTGNVSGKCPECGTIILPPDTKPG